MEDSSRRLEDFAERELIASGSFSQVYRCIDCKDGSVRALKIAKTLESYEQERHRGNPDLRPQSLELLESREEEENCFYRTTAFGWGSEFLQTVYLDQSLTPSDLLLRQAEKLRACCDSSLVSFIEAGVSVDQAYLCMEYLAGPTLRELVRRGGASVQNLIEVLEGLDRLYSRHAEFEHGDLKPENIIVTAAGAKMIDPGDFFSEKEIRKFSNPVCVTTSAYYPLLSANDSVACGAMLWEIVLDCQPFASWTDRSPHIGPRLARYEGIPLHPVYRRPYHSGAWRLGSVRRPASLIPSISKELEALLLGALGLELDADGKIEMLRRDTFGPANNEETAKVPRERISVLREDLIKYHDELEELRRATRISIPPGRRQVAAAPLVVSPVRETLFTRSLSSGEEFGGYLLQKFVANGAFCGVYEALNPKDGSLCALKIGKPMDQIGGLPTRLWGAPTKEHHTGAVVQISGGTRGVTLSSAEVLEKQAAHLLAWNDARVVQLREHGASEDLTFLCLEYLPGPTLRQLIRARQSNLQTLVEILEALERLAVNSPIPFHGDLKPENIIVAPAGAKMIDPGYFGDVGGEKNIAITTRAYYPLLQPNDLFACGLILWEIILNCHPLLNHWAGSDSAMIGPKLEDKMSHAFGSTGVFLEQLSMVRKPSMVDSGITPAMEDLLLKAIGLQQLADGKIDLDEGFKSFRDLKNELARQIGDGHVTGR